MKPLKTNYRRNLPHIQPIGSLFFITFNLQGAIPKHIWDLIQSEKNAKINHLKESNHPNFYEEKIKEHKRYFAQVDSVLDGNRYGERYLANHDVAKVLMDKIISYDRSSYDLIACCIMSNHVHLLIDLYIQIENIPASTEITEKNYKPIYDIMKLIKGGSAFEVNKILNRKGRFWQVEYYDHFVRDKKEFINIIYYIANNPVKAGIVKNWQDYRFTYIKEEFKINLP